MSRAASTAALTARSAGYRLFTFDHVGGNRRELPLAWWFRLTTEFEGGGCMAEADESIVPVKSGKAKPALAERLGLLDELESEMERFWRRPWSLWPGPLMRPLRGIRESLTLAPRMDAYTKGDMVVVTAELPGLKKEHVQVEVEGDTLVIRGESKAESEVKEEDYYRSERSYGSFYRRLQLPSGVKPDQIQATLQDGVLQVSIPKPVEDRSESRTIPVT
jgi:HSP20 family protein